MKAVLFDMDGTLLPMDLNYFVRRYFDALGAHFVPFEIGRASCRERV